MHLAPAKALFQPGQVGLLVRDQAPGHDLVIERRAWDGGDHHHAAPRIIHPPHQLYGLVQRGLVLAGIAEDKLHLHRDVQLFGLLHGELYLLHGDLFVHVVEDLLAARFDAVAHPDAAGILDHAQKLRIHQVDPGLGPPGQAQPLQLRGQLGELPLVGDEKLIIQGDLLHPQATLEDAQ